MLERVWRKGNPLTLLVGMQTSTATMENSVEISKKLEIELPYDPAIPLLGIHTKETRSERDTCTPMFIAALFIIARTWKQPRCPSADEWIRKLWSILFFANQYDSIYYPQILFQESSAASINKIKSLLNRVISQKGPIICVQADYVYHVIVVNVS